MGTVSANGPALAAVATATTAVGGLILRARRRSRGGLDVHGVVKRVGKVSRTVGKASKQLSEDVHRLGEDVERVGKRLS